MANWKTFSVTVFMRGLSPFRRYCVPGTVSSEILSQPAESTKELKRRDPRTGEKRVGNNFVYEMELSALANRLGFSINQLPSLQRALTHKSALTDKDAKDSELHNSDLALVGRKLMMQVIRSHLSSTYPNLRNRMVWDIMHRLINHPALDRVARHVGVANLVLTRESYNEEMIAKSFSAVLGAICTDRGEEASVSLVHQFVLPQLQDIDLKDVIKVKNPVYILWLVLKEQRRRAPILRLIKESGRLTHFPTFVVGVYSGTRFLAEGAGSSIKRAKNEAAMAALRLHYMKEVKKETDDTTDLKGLSSRNRIIVDRASKGLPDQ